MEISGSQLASLANLMSTSQLQKQHETAVLKMAQDQVKQNGENALQLIEATPCSACGGALGAKLDVMA